jgi:hypothetical protein
LVYGLAARSAAEAGADAATALSPVNARRSFFMIELQTFLSPSEVRCLQPISSRAYAMRATLPTLARHFRRFCDSQKSSSCRHYRRSRNPDWPIRWTNRGWPPTSHIATRFLTRVALLAHASSVLSRGAAPFTLARSRTRTIAHCCNCNGIRVARRWARSVVLQFFSDQNAADVAPPVSST